LPAKLEDAAGILGVAKLAFETMNSSNVAVF